MTFELKSIFTVQDNATAKIRQMTRQVQKLSAAMDKAIQSSNKVVNNINHLSGAMNHQQAQVNRVTTTIIHNTNVMNHHSNTVNNNTNTINRNTTARNTLIGAVGRESSALKGLSSTLGMLGGAYAVAAGGSKLFNSTIGAAARFEQSSTVLASMMNDAEKYKQYMKMIDKIAIDSPLLNSADMVAGSKGLLTMTKDLKLLESSWATISKLTALNPLQGVDGAVYSLKALRSGDVESIVDRYDMSRADINPLKGLSFKDQIKGLDEVLKRMNVTDQLVEEMSKTSLGQYNSLLERISTFLRDVGLESNTSLGKFLTRLNKGIDKLDVTSLSNKLGDMLNSATNKAIAFAGWVWKWKEPLSYAVSALAVAGAAFAAFGIIGALASPISLIAAGIGAAGIGMKALYDNSETFRGAIDGVTSKVKTLFGAFKTGGVNGLLDAILPKDISTQIQHIIGNIRGQISTLKHAFKTGGFGGIVDVLFGEGTFEGLAAKFNEVKTFITTKIAEMQPGLETLKGVFSSVWGTISNIFSTVWNSVLKPGLANFWDALQILANVATVVFNNVIAPGLQFAAALFSTLWAVAGPVLSLLGATLRVTFAVLKSVWDNILLPFTKFLTGALKNAFDIFTDAVNIVGGAFSWVGGLIDKVAGKISSFADTIKNIKLPDWVTKGVSATVNLVGKAIGAKPDGSHYNGLARVPFNNYLANLHRGEKILTRYEADQYDEMMRGKVSGVATADYNSTTQNLTTNKTTIINQSSTGSSRGGRKSAQAAAPVIKIGKLTEQVVVREEADIAKIAAAFAKEIAGRMVIA